MKYSNDIADLMAGNWNALTGSQTEEAPKVKTKAKSYKTMRDQDKNDR